MLNENDGKEHRPILTPLERREDFIESRLIIYRYLSKGMSFVAATTSRAFDSVQETLLEAMEYTENVRYPINVDTMTRELTFTSLLSQGTSLPAEIVEIIIFSRLLNQRSMGIRGAFWVASMLSNTHAPTPPSPTIPTVSPGVDA